MHNIHRYVLVWLLLLCSTMARENFIVLSYGNHHDMAEQKIRYQNYVKTHDIPKSKIDIKKFEDSYILQIGPFERSSALALTYMKIKDIFSDAVIIENSKPIVIYKNINKVEPKAEESDSTIWIALFGLAIVGILFMFLSSDKIKRLKKEHEKIKNKHKNLQRKQHEILSRMGENIHTIAKETMSHAGIMAEKIKETPFYEEMEKMMCNENELLDVTKDLIEFLYLKSKKVVIQNEVFNFSHVLNEVAGTLNQTHKQNDMELIFDIDREIPRYMFSDSLHMGQILTNLLEYIVQHTQSQDIKLKVVTRSNFKDGQKLYFTINSKLKIESAETLFTSYYDENLRRYVGLGLFIAKELTLLMEGSLEVLNDEEGYQYFKLVLPIKEKNIGKYKYNLPSKELAFKKILIVDKNIDSSNAIEKLFSYFKLETTVISSRKFLDNMPDFSSYDIVALSDILFTSKVLKELKQLKESKKLKIISINNLFSSNQLEFDNAIDVSMAKPVTQEYVFDTLIRLYNIKTNKTGIVNKYLSPKMDKKSLKIHRNKFDNANNINLESFKAFNGAHVMVVEDNIINQKVVLNVLGKSDMKLSVANNGEEAVEFMSTNTSKVDLILMDINMPIMDGYRASELIRNDSRHDKVPIVSLTALTSRHEIEKMFEAGMNGYLAKPLEIGKLYSALDTFVHAEKKEKISKVKNNTNKPMKLDGLRARSNSIFYKEILKEFMDAYAKSDLIFEKLVNEKRYMQIKMLCFEMKGLTRTIGANDMYTVINEIHQHIVYKKPELLHSYISKYKTELTKLNASIERYLSN